MSVESSVQATIEALGGDLIDSAEAATALEIARGMDNAKNSLTSKAMAGKTLNDTMDRLRAMAPPRREKDGVDDLAEARERRRRAAATD